MSLRKMTIIFQAIGAPIWALPDEEKGNEVQIEENALWDQNLGLFFFPIMANKHQECVFQKQCVIPEKKQYI